MDLLLVHKNASASIGERIVPECHLFGGNNSVLSLVIPVLRSLRWVWAWVSIITRSLNLLWSIRLSPSKLSRSKVPNRSLTLPCGSVALLSNKWEVRLLRVLRKLPGVSTDKASKIDGGERIMGRWGSPLGVPRIPPVY